MNEDELLKRSYLAKILFTGALVATPFMLAGCTTTNTKSEKTVQPAKESGVTIHNGKKTYTYTAKDRECLERAMFFESARSSRSGLVAVGTVVMNRLVSEKYPATICGVVSQKNQFAPGVMSRAMNPKNLPDVKEAAQAVLKGERHPVLKNSMFFHTAGLKFPYKNMHYVLVAGGNAFYEKRRKDGSLEAPIPDAPYNVAAAYDAKDQSMPEQIYDVTTDKGGRVAPGVDPIMVAAVDNQRFAPPQTVSVPQNAPQTVAEQVPVQLAYHVPVPSEPQHAFAAVAEEVNPQKVDAIGEILLSQARPQQAY